jgi:hypothetical protein
MQLHERIEERIAELAEDAARFRRYGQEPQAALLEALADDLRAAIAGDTVSPAEAAERGLCHEETVRRIVRADPAKNLGTPGAIRVRVSDIPAGRRRRTPTPPAPAPLSGASMMGVVNSRIGQRRG